MHGFVRALRGICPFAGMAGHYTVKILESKYGCFPDHYIPFPQGEELWYRYSVKSVCPQALTPGHIFNDQIKAYTKYILKPPLGGHGSMDDGDETTVEMRSRTLCQYIGFCYSKLELPPNITHVLNPVAVSAACGFWEARGLSPATIKLRVQHLTQAAPFVSSKYCPRQQEWSRSHLSQCQSWFKKLSAKALADYSKAPKKTHNVHLHEAFDFSSKDWVAFTLEFKVMAQNPPPPPSSQPPCGFVGKQLPVDPQACTVVPNSNSQNPSLWPVPAPHQGRGSEDPHEPFQYL